MMVWGGGEGVIYVCVCVYIYAIALSIPRLTKKWGGSPRKPTHEPRPIYGIRDGTVTSHAVRSPQGALAALRLLGVGGGDKGEGGDAPSSSSSAFAALRLYRGTGRWVFVLWV